MSNVGNQDLLDTHMKMLENLVQSILRDNPGLTINQLINQQLINQQLISSLSLPQSFQSELERFFMRESAVRIRDLKITRFLAKRNLREFPFLDLGYFCLPNRDLKVQGERDKFRRAYGHLKTEVVISGSLSPRIVRRRPLQTTNDALVRTRSRGQQLQLSQFVNGIEMTLTIRAAALLSDGIALFVSENNGNGHSEQTIFMPFSAFQHTTTDLGLRESAFLETVYAIASRFMWRSQVRAPQMIELPEAELEFEPQEQTVPTETLVPENLQMVVYSPGPAVRPAPEFRLNPGLPNMAGLLFLLGFRLPELPFLSLGAQPLLQIMDGTIEGAITDSVAISPRVEDAVLAPSTVDPTADELRRLREEQLDRNEFEGLLGEIRELERYCSSLPEDDKNKQPAMKYIATVKFHMRSCTAKGFTKAACTDLTGNIERDTREFRVKINPRNNTLITLIGKIGKAIAYLALRIVGRREHAKRLHAFTLKPTRQLLADRVVKEASQVAAGAA